MDALRFALIHFSTHQPPGGFLGGGVVDFGGGAVAFGLGKGAGRVGNDAFAARFIAAARARASSMLSGARTA